jgi:hypothetical protein
MGRKTQKLSLFPWMADVIPEKEKENGYEKNTGWLNNWRKINYDTYLYQEDYWSIGGSGTSYLTPTRFIPTLRSFISIEIN